MPVLLQALLLSMISPPKPVNITDWMVGTDIDKNILPVTYGSSWLRLIIDENGKPSDCQVRKSSGSTEVDRFTCILLLNRSRFKPATDQHGNAVAGVFEHGYNWNVDGHKLVPTLADADLQLSISSIPQGLEDHQQIWAYLIVSELGNVEDCEAIQAVPRNKQSQAAAPLLKLACSEATKSWPITISSKGKFSDRRALESVLVQFDLEGANITSSMTTNGAVRASMPAGAP